ncbi:hypothetical protein PAPYR_4910 [Paratrimastix pyriformis]|uniref:Dynein light chain n=1 Tax=Paratrimastix pyriformis TaxID=342808 RepID=A0ABQ8UIR2_9EUKA|nr:hypothetical protein PAPYR_4910 [Paratrimastix pyriformis]
MQEKHDEPLKLEILFTDMNAEMTQFLTTCAHKFQEEVLEVMKDQFIERFERRIADFFKDEFDKRFGSQWHCLCGQFAASVTHESRTLVHFEMQFSPQEKRPHHHKSESVADRKRNAPPVRYWKVLLFKAG